MYWEVYWKLILVHFWNITFVTQLSSRLSVFWGHSCFCLIFNEVCKGQNLPYTSVHDTLLTGVYAKPFYFFMSSFIHLCSHSLVSLPSLHMVSYVFDMKLFICMYFYEMCAFVLNCSALFVLNLSFKSP